MNIIIAGIGKVGASLVRHLSLEGHDLTLIDRSKARMEAIADQYDILSVTGNCASMSLLLDAGIMNADLLIAATNADEVNLLCCMTAHSLNPKLHTIARIRNPEYTEQAWAMREQFGLSLTVNPERNAAVEIERLLKFPGFLRRDSFAKGRAEIVELRIDPGSKLAGVSLIDMYRTIKAKVLVCAVLRNGTAITPSGTFVLQEGDRIFVTAPTAHLALLLKNLGIITRRVRRVLLGGGGHISYYLAQLLEKDGISVHILDSDLNRCQSLAELLPNASISHGDFSSQNYLDSEGLDRYDAVISMTGIDEINLLASHYASSQGVPLVITKISRNENSRMADVLSLGSVICPRELSCQSIVRYVRAMGNQTGAAASIHTIADGQAEAIEFQITPEEKYCSVPLRELKLKPNVLIACIIHKNQALIPNGESTFLPGDTVMIVTSGQDILQQFSDIFA